MKTIYVDLVNGSDENKGTNNSPLLTTHKAMSICDSGDFLIISTQQKYLVIGSEAIVPITE